MCTALVKMLLVFIITQRLVFVGDIMQKKLEEIYLLCPILRWIYANPKMSVIEANNAITVINRFCERRETLVSFSD